MPVVSDEVTLIARRRVPWRTSLLCALAAAILFTGWAKGRGYKTWAIRQVFPEFAMGHSPSVPQPSIVRTRPANHEGNILPSSAFVAADVDLPYGGKVVDGRTLNSDSVQLYRTCDHQSVSAVVNTSGAGDAIVLRPVQPLQTNTQYTFEVTPAAKDTGGHPFHAYQASFWTAAGEHLSDFPAAFHKVPLPIASDHMFTCVTIGPDHKLYASALTGQIIRYTIAADGTLVDKQEINSVNQANGEMRLITGIAFDPASTAENLILWVSHGQLPSQGEKGQAWIRGALEWTGKISRLSGLNLDNYRDVIVNLPRAWKDHLNNQVVFGSDGALYFCQAANTAMGAPDAKWGFRPERLLTAAILRVDIRAIENHIEPLNVQTEPGGTYDPYAPGAPLTIYATGIRNSYDLCWHSNGCLYAGINGSAAGGNAPASSGPAFAHREKRPATPSLVSGGISQSSVSQKLNYPVIPALANIPETEDDMLFKVDPGGYYGHPNPTRGEYVLNGGNPAPNTNAYQVHAYPLGTLPDPNWRPAIFSFGKNLSPCGVIEYHSPIFHGALKGKLLYVRYSGGDDIEALSLDSHGDVAEAITGIEGFGRFVNPVDLTEDPATGNIYVAEFGGKRITLVRPVSSESMDGDGVVSHRVCRVQVGRTAISGLGSMPMSCDIPHKSTIVR